MKHNRTLAIILTCVLVIAAVFIGLQGKPVNRDSSLYVTDTVGVISPDAEVTILYTQSRISPRLNVAIVENTGKLSTADYCEALWKNWRLGSSDLLLLMVTGKQDYYFGYDTSASHAPLMDANFDLLMERYLEPDFAAGNYEQAVLSLIEGLQMVLANTESFSSGTYYTTYSPDSGKSTIFLLILVLAVIVVAVMAANSIGKTNRRRTATTYRTPTPPTGMPRHTGTYRTTTHTSSRPTARPTIRPRSTTSSLPRTTTFRPSTSSRPVSRSTTSRSSSRSSFGGGGRSRSGGFGGGGRSSGGFGGGGRSGGMGGRGRR